VRSLSSTICRSSPIFLNQVESFFDGAGDDGAVADLDDRAVEQTGVRGDRREDLRFGRIFGQAEFLELGLFGPQ
jgi:hypothetical protein